MVFTKNYTNSKDYSSMTPAIRRKGLSLRMVFFLFCLHHTHMHSPEMPHHALSQMLHKDLHDVSFSQLILYQHPVESTARRTCLEYAHMHAH